MDAEHRSITLRLAVLLVLLLLHGGLILVFSREKPVDSDQRVSAEVPAILFFVPAANPPPEIERVPPRATRALRHPPLPKPDGVIANPGASTPAPVDWSAEAHRAASEMLSHGEPGRAAETPAAPPAPWDSRPLIESTGHGMQIRIPVEIPGHLIDHCFVNIDMDHDQTGQMQRYQLGCALGKTPARGDLFDSLRKPNANGARTNQ